MTNRSESRKHTTQTYFGRINREHQSATNGPNQKASFSAIRTDWIRAGLAPSTFQNLYRKSSDISAPPARRWEPANAKNRFPRLLCRIAAAEEYCAVCFVFCNLASAMAGIRASNEMMLVWNRVPFAPLAHEGMMSGRASRLVCPNEWDKRKTPVARSCNATTCDGCFESERRGQDCLNACSLHFAVCSND
jgi:hypothetical protein